MKAILLLTVFVGLARAEIIFQPSVLERGDRYRLMFLTSQTRDATQGLAYKKHSI